MCEEIVMFDIHKNAARIFKIDYSDIPERHKNERQNLVSDLIKRKVWGQGPSYKKLVDRLVDEIKESSNLFIDSYNKAITNEGFINDDSKRITKDRVVEFIKKQYQNTCIILDDYLARSEMPDNVKKQNFNSFTRKVNNIIDTHAEKISLIIDSHNKSMNFTVSNSKSNNFISKSRIEELRKIKNPEYDLTRLIKLCDELNIAYLHNSYMSMAMIQRAIIDHVPPIFGFKSFTEVANNYKGNSFKKTMQRLESSLRNISNIHLHKQIGKKEVIPTIQQVNFASELDLLISEIIARLS